MNGLYTKITPSGPVGPLLTSNPNLNNPTRLTHSQALTCDQNHGYTAEQEAVNGGKMDKFVQFTDTSTCSAPNYGTPGLVMDYYDGNTVTGLWNYAQNYAMSENNYDTTFGPSTPGALNLISGQTGGSYAVNPITGAPEASTAVSPLNSAGLGTIFGDPDPAYDNCSDASHTTTSPVAICDRQERRRPAQRQGHHLGLVPGRVRAHRDELGRLRGLRLHPQEHRRRHGRPTTRRTTSRSSTTSPRLTPTTCRRRRRRPSATPTRPTTSTTCRTSTPRSATGTCRRSAS